MKIDGLQTFLAEVQSEFKPEGIDANIYYFYDDVWRDLSCSSVCDSATTNYLTRSKLEQVAFHATNHLDAWFYFSSADCVVCLTCSKSPQLQTRRKYRERLQKIEESASNAYKVSHNQLTHLLAKNSFRERLASAITDVERPEMHNTEALESGVARALAVMALDIDHFKQVNDTWGHLYGDQVLRTFGRRLENCADDIQEKGVGDPTISLGHPSGEEFLIFIQANVLREQFVEWANDFRKSIADEVLPTDTEWQWLSSSGSIGVLQLPPTQDRSTTVSVGVALHNSASLLGQRSEEVSDLLDRADTALYRAKAAGRNQVICYDEILSSCGRVIEQDKNTRVVALDIGSNVGVSEGQEFKVFSPTFSGKTKFFINDGRTKRTLGEYPRVQSARIVIFNAQPEISFAYVAEPEPSNSDPLLEPGSHLEAIPAGSIGHLLPSFSKYLPSTSDKHERGVTSELLDFIKTSVSNNGAPFAVVVRFTREGEYLRKYGTVALNTALAKLYREAQIVFPPATLIELLDRGSICIAGPNSVYKESIVTDFIESVTVDLHELGVFAGIFCEADRESSTSDTENSLDATNAVEFARFAAADAGRKPETRLRHFSYSVASSVLGALLESNAFEIAYADFERLRRLGVESARLFNLGGLIAVSLGNRRQALEHYSAAISRDSETLVYKSNYATSAYILKEFDPALKILNPVSLEEIDKLRLIHPFGYHCYARLLAMAWQNKSIFFDSSRFLHIANIALSIPEFQKSPDNAVIREALASLTEIQ
ncbi:GGDEF domain-containing protein [Methylomonas sp. ZR1]|uniref:GGDEF domain-containing protein n=1 Tax=Methylomonas sp. ZR1 TaxID=1797072 RepID=UPI001492FFDD|nr:GGDEF domain-containing protein [Methylomonas sp. ZR1]NOV29147.1 GGDEF domain-containing protein [Methylomonas sp. ZR1]